MSAGSCCRYGVVLVLRLTWVLGLEVSLALQRGGQVIEAQRELALEGRVLLAERGKTAERALPHQLLQRGVAPRDGVRLGTLPWRCGALRR